MADFDLSLVIRAQDQGASAASDKLGNSLNKLSAEEIKAARSAEQLRASTAKAEQAEIQAAAAADRAALAALRLAQAQTRAGNEVEKAGRKIKQAGVNSAQVGFQIQDITQQLALGVNPLVVLMQQGGQTASALSGLGGVAGTVARFFAGPFGSLLIAGVGILGTLALTSNKAEKAQKDLGDGMDFAKMSAGELIKAIGELEAAQRKAIRTSYESEQAQLADAAAALKAARGAREKAKAVLEGYLISQRVNAGQGTGGVAGQAAGILAEEARADIAALNASIGSAEALERAAQVPIIRREIAAATDDAAAATLRYDKAETDLRNSFLKTGDLEAYRKGLTRITEAREADLKKAREQSRADPLRGRDLANFGNPVPGARISSGYGARDRPTAGASTNHLGVDYAAKIGTAVLAAFDGVIKRTGTAGGYGNQIELAHGGGTETRYSHLSAFNVQEGQQVRKGDVIGRVGNTGTTTGPHLHYEVLVNGKKVDPKAGKFPFDPADVATVADRAAEELQRFGERAGEGIARITAEFDEQPKLIDRAAKATRELDALITELSNKQPLNFKEMIADAERAKTVVAEGINRPYNDFIASQAEALDIQRLITSGREAEAEAMRIILGLERQMGPLTPARKDAVLATVQALKAEERQLEITRAKQQKYLDQLRDVKDAVRSIFSDPIEGLKDLPKRLIAAAGQFKADQLFEKLFGETFRELEDQITGANSAKDASDRMARAVDGVSASARRVEAAFNGVASAAQSPGGGTSGIPSLSVDDIGGAFPGSDEIVVTGKRPTGLPQILEKLAKGVGVSDAAAAKIGSITGKAVGGAATGAMTNSFLKPLGKALGFKTSQTGAQIGGAIGSFIPIPGGDIIGSVIGSVVGGLFKKTKYGKASITSVDGDASLSGNSGGMREAAGGAASSIQDGLSQIAEALGGGLGSFNVAIGQRHGDWRVNTSGGSLKKKKGATEFDDDAEGAIAFAIMDAIKDGAVTGLSRAVTQALQSNEDVDRALREALKVKDLEDMIGGLGNRLSTQFRDYDRISAERVKLAKKYGLDLIAVERINAEERSKLVENLITSRIGSLTQFKEDMRSGDLFEGDAATRRGALLETIAKVQKEAEAGSDGAADQLADLYRQLIATSKDAFGTAGPELAADRAAALSGVDRVIEMENARIAEAQAYQANALAAQTQNNQLTNETNNLIAITNANLQTLIGREMSAGGFGPGGPPADIFAAITRTRKQWGDY